MARNEGCRPRTTVAVLAAIPTAVRAPGTASARSGPAAGAAGTAVAAPAAAEKLALRNHRAGIGFGVPEDGRLPGKEHVVDVAAAASNGNRSVSDVSFRTGALHR